MTQSNVLKRPHNDRGFDQVPVLADTLRADTADVLHGVAKHDMAEAIEHVVRGIGDVKGELQKAFLARDTGCTGALGGSAFKVWRPGRSIILPTFRGQAGGAVLSRGKGI